MAGVIWVERNTGSWDKALPEAANPTVTAAKQSRPPLRALVLEERATTDSWWAREMMRSEAFSDARFWVSCKREKEVGREVGGGGGRRERERVI